MTKAIKSRPMTRRVIDAIPLKNLRRIAKEYDLKGLKTKKQIVAALRKEIRNGNLFHVSRNFIYKRTETSPKCIYIYLSTSKT